MCSANRSTSALPSFTLRPLPSRIAKLELLRPIFLCTITVSPYTSGWKRSSPTFLKWISTVASAQPCLMKSFIEEARFVVLALVPIPTQSAVSTALLPLPFRPMMKVVYGPSSTSMLSWHMKFVTLILWMYTRPTPADVDSSPSPRIPPAPNRGLRTHTHRASRARARTPPFAASGSRARDARSARRRRACLRALPARPRAAEREGAVNNDNLARFFSFVFPSVSSSASAGRRLAWCSAPRWLACSSAMAMAMDSCFSRSYRVSSIHAESSNK